MNTAIEEDQRFMIRATEAAFRIGLLAVAHQIWMAWALAGAEEEAAEAEPATWT